MSRPGALPGPAEAAIEFSYDRARLETVRADQIRLADEASQRFVQGIADAAEVLTPEQRAALVARMQRHHDWQEP